ncbi:MAG: Hpt domain-containing protein [Elsteraceae bacterium]
MDGYVAKPINVALLDETILRLLPQAGDLRRAKAPPGPPEPATPSSKEDEADSGASALDLAVVEENFGAIGPDAQEMLDMFLSSTAPLIDELDQALASGAEEAARDAAHSARGAANMAGARHLGDLLTEIELALKAGDAAKAKLILPAVRPAFTAVEQAVARLCDKVGVG